MEYEEVDNHIEDLKDFLKDKEVADKNKINKSKIEDKLPFIKFKIKIGRRPNSHQFLGHLNGQQ